MYDTKDLYDLLSVFPTQDISRPDEEKTKIIQNLKKGLMESMEKS